MKWLAILITVVSLGVVACSGAAATSTAPSATSPAAPVATAIPTASSAASRCGGSLEGCFSYAQMADYLDAVLPMVADFFQSQYPKVSAPRDVVYVAHNRGAASACGSYATDQSYEYCPSNRTIYVGQDMLWLFYKQAGDAAPALGLAHEWGHHLQAMLGVPYARTAAQSVNYENQADCIAGAWAKHAQQRGWLEANDLKDVSNLLQLVGSRESPLRDHGTTAERTAAFQLNYAGGLKACDSYFPGAPIT